MLIELPALRALIDGLELDDASRAALEKSLRGVEKAAGKMQFLIQRSRNDKDLQFNLLSKTSEDLRKALAQTEDRVEARTHELAEANAALRLAKDAAEDANRTKSQFLANMSHELRTPLNAIIGYSEMLIEEANDLETAGTSDLDVSGMVADLGKIRSAGRHLLDLINAVLDLSKIEAGKMDVFVEEFDAAELVEEVVATIRPLIERGSNEFKLRIETTPGRMGTDKAKLRQILLNLLSNAVKFTDGGVVTLRVAAADGAAGTMLFEVADTGIGMTPEQLSRLFQPFVQVDAAVGGRYGGTGLGLSITRRFTEMLGGAVSVASEPGRGTTFSVQVPRELGSATVTGRAAELQVWPDTVDAARQRVLVVDDDAEARDVVARMLIREGYDVMESGNAEDALQKARQWGPDAITLDVLLPGADGWDVLVALKADPALRSTPVVLVTMVDRRNLGFALGAADYIMKPVDRSQLLATLERTLATPM
jgi:signal transduction histidine kinase